MHIMCRGNNKQVVFKSTDDKRYYYYLIRELKQENKITIYHYCIMNNHVHLLVWVNTQSNISRFMQQISLAYFRYYQKTYKYCGHLWQGRFKSNIINTDCYLLQCGKYIELNPVRAGLVVNADEYEFSSYNFYAKNSTDFVVTPNPLYIQLHKRKEERTGEYANYEINNRVINTQSFREKYFIGDEDFVKTMEEQYRIPKPKKSGRPRKTQTVSGFSPAIPA